MKDIIKHMQAKYKWISNNQKGFTMLELLMVIIVIGILASLGIPKYQQFMEKSRKAEAIQAVSMIKNRIHMKLAENPNFVITYNGITSELNMPVYSDAKGTFFSYYLYNVPPLAMGGRYAILAWRSNKDKPAGSNIQGYLWSFDKNGSRVKELTGYISPNGWR
ncbi:MAG: prepilin-type N-terminal cleavage/methylation domain-containing protein [Candidatus Omnitrophica bacterium]|nr:prepilin-type N-terminal cleavage/methylation domain-containing protein [Candidatus Omnitrophota bacterium]